MQNHRGNGMLVMKSAAPVTDRDEARRLITADVLKRSKQARSHFRIAPKEDRTWSGIVFDSALEMKNHIALNLQQDMGLISNLRRQVWYDLKIGSFLITRYRADHVYFDNTLKREIVADSKGKRTESFIIKKKLMQLIYGIEVIEM